MESEERKQINEILAYAAERGIEIPADVLLELARQDSADLLLRKIPPELLPLFTLTSPGAVPAPKDARLILGAQGWRMPPTPQVYYGGGGIGSVAPLTLDPGNDRVGVNRGTPQAQLDLGAGKSTPFGAPLRFETGTLLTVPEAGVMEFDGTGLYLTPTNHRRFISLASDSMNASATATTMAATTLWTGITNANELKAQRVYVIKGCGLYTTHDASQTATITVNLATVVALTLTTPAGKVTDEPWYFEVFFTVRTIGETGTVSSFGKMDASTGNTYGVSESFVVDTTIINDVTVKCSWTDALNSLTMTQCWLATAD